ncbi:putative ribonuclease H-like domain-containing protein [Tanacetum coccineum]
MSLHTNDDFSQHLSDDEASYHEDASKNDTATNKPKQQQQLIPTTTTILNIKLPILKKKEYDIWAMEMEHYLEYIDNDVWKERKAKTILLMAIPKEHLRRFHGMDDSKEIWEAIRTSSEGLEKGYDRFQQLLLQLEAHGAEVSTEDANHKFLRSLPPAWSNLVMTMRTKPDVDTLSIGDLYNNLRVFEQELTSTLKSSANAQNVAFASHSKSSTNKVKSGHTGAYSTCTPTSSNNIQEREVPAGFADEVIYSLFAKQSKDLPCLGKQLVLLAISLIGKCPSKGTNDRKKRDSFYQDQGAGKKEQNQNCLLTIDDGVVNWGEHIVEEEETNHALMAISSNTEVSLCSKTCIDSYNKLKTLYDEQMNQLDLDSQCLPGPQTALVLKDHREIGALLLRLSRFRIEELLSPNSNCDSGPTFIRTVNAKDHPLKNMEDRGIFDSGCSGHMTGNKDHLDDFEEYKGGSVTFGGSKGYITGKGRIRVVSPDFKIQMTSLPLPKLEEAYIVLTLYRGNLVRGLPSKVFRNDHTCVVCQKGKQHKASCKAKLVRTITEPLYTLHMDLFGPSSVKSINLASYCLVITDDCTRFSWVFFLATKDETSGILQNFIRQIENQLNHRVKIIRSDNGTEFKNRDMLEFCGNKGIKQEYSNARTPQQNGVAERMNRTLIEAANLNRKSTTGGCQFLGSRLISWLYLDCMEDWSMTEVVKKLLMANINPGQADQAGTQSQPSLSTVSTTTPHLHLHHRHPQPFPN